MKKGHELIQVGSHEIEISNRRKVLFPDAGITKGDLIGYYEAIAGTMLPHVEGRLLSMRRFPEGIAHEGFFQKEISDYFPGWIDRFEASKESGKTTYVVCNNAATLVYLANQAVISAHVSLSRVGSLYNPDEVVFDLDPADGSFSPVRAAARLTGELLRQLGFEPFLKTTGSKGLHVYVPLDGKADYPQVRSFARSLAAVIALRDPRRTTTEQRIEKRRGRVYIDAQRNAYGQTAVAPYSVRARPGAPVSAPILWDDLKNSRLKSNHFTVRNIFKRLDRQGDPWRDLWKRPFSIDDTAWQRLSELEAETARK